MRVCPLRAVFACTSPMTAEQVLQSLDASGAAHRSVMVVAPEGLGGHSVTVDERDYGRARRAEGPTVAALRRAGIASEREAYDRHIDCAALKRRTGADVRVLDAIEI